MREGQDLIVEMQARPNEDVHVKAFKGRFRRA